MLFSDTIAVYRENHAEYINTHCGQNEVGLYVKVAHKILRMSMIYSIKDACLQVLLVTSSLEYLLCVISDNFNEHY
jgi:hypothetical protein